jgi:hypothetical protein
VPTHTSMSSLTWKKKSATSYVMSNELVEEGDDICRCSLLTAMWSSMTWCSQGHPPPVVDWPSSCSKAAQGRHRGGQDLDSTTVGIRTPISRSCWGLRAARHPRRPSTPRSSEAVGP